MNIQLQKHLNSLESQREALLLLLKSLSTEQLNKRLGTKWSIAEIVNHLIAAERTSLLYVQKKILGVETLADTGVWEEIKITLLKISQRLPGLKFKAPQIVVNNTTLHKDLTTLWREWDQLRSQLTLFLEKIPDQHITRKIYRHPIAGYLNLQHTLIFFREHIIHHMPQLKKLLP